MPTTTRLMLGEVLVLLQPGLLLGRGALGVLRALSKYLVVHDDPLEAAKIRFLGE